MVDLQNCEASIILSFPVEGGYLNCGQRYLRGWTEFGQIFFI